MKVVVIGGVTGGASCAARIRRIDQSAEVIVFEKGRDISYSNCALPYYLSGIVQNESSLILMTPQRFKSLNGIEARVNSEVIKINRDDKTVTVKNLVENRTYEESYDVLVYATGARPIRPRSIKGVNNSNVFTVRNVQDIELLKSRTDEVSDVAVIGGGFIGVEVAENLAKAGKKLTVIEAARQLLSIYDYDMVQIIHKELLDNGVDVFVDSTVTEITDDEVRFVRYGNDCSVKAEAVVLAVGVAPEVALARECGLKIGETGGIEVNDRMQTSDPDIYAVGDAVECRNMITGRKERLPLAGPAQRQARIAANNICGREDHFRGFIGSSCIKVFNQNCAATGLNEEGCRKAGIDYDYVMVIPTDKVSVLPGSNYLILKVLFEKETGRLLGAQAISKGEVDKRINVVAALISHGATIDDLKEVELCYAPVFSTPKDAVNMAGFVADNILDGDIRQVHVNEVRGLVESGACIIDVREVREYESGHLINAVNIPLSQLSDRYQEIPKDRNVYLHCRSSQRSYNAIRFLQGKGYDNLYNISGSYLGISLYEYFDDVTKGREKILTEYNFR